MIGFSKRDGLIIDIHTHVSPIEYPEVPQGLEQSCCGRWPAMSGQTPDKKWLLSFGSQPFRTIEASSWDPTVRLAEMHDEGIAVQVLSPMPELLSYWLPLPGATVVLERVNSLIAEMVHNHPTRFFGLAAVPMQDPSLAAKLIYDVPDKLGLHGIEVGSNVNGTYLGDPRFDEVWAAAEDADICVFVHGIHPVAFANGNDRVLSVFAGIPSDVAASAASLLVSGVLEKFPRLRIALSHGGGGISSMLGRMDRGWGGSEGFGGRSKIKPSELASRFFYDSNIFDRQALGELCTRFPGRVCAGSDYPYALAQRGLSSYLESVGLAKSEHESLRAGAARKLLGSSRLVS